MSLRAIYEPKGKAKEYADLAVNLYTGCPHRCVYCYVPAILHKTREDFHSSVESREDILAKLQHDCEELAKRDSLPPIHLCFICDPYPVGCDTATTRAAIMLIKAVGLNFTVLTKGASDATFDFSLYGGGDSFGVTLTFTSDADSRHWEPYGNSPVTRRNALREAHKLGIATWVSLEPVIDPEQTLMLITATAPFVDHYKIGKLNYHPYAKTIDWANFVKRVVKLLESLGKSYYLKESLRAYLPGEPTKQVPW